MNHQERDSVIAERDEAHRAIAKYLEKWRAAEAEVARLKLLLTQAKKKMSLRSYQAIVVRAEEGRFTAEAELADCEDRHLARDVAGQTALAEAEAERDEQRSLSHEHYEAYVSEVALRQAAEARVTELEAALKDVPAEDVRAALAAPAKEDTDD